MIKNKYLSPTFIFLAFSFFIIVFNAVDLCIDTVKIQKIRQSMPFNFSGFKFLGLESVFKNIAYVGYYTDRELTAKRSAEQFAKDLKLKPNTAKILRDLSLKQNAAQFAEAQYILAPTILDLNNTDHEFILFDCTTEKVAYEKMKEIHAIPLKKNPYGIILARKIK